MSRQAKLAILSAAAAALASSSAFAGVDGNISGDFGSALAVQGISTNWGTSNQLDGLYGSYSTGAMNFALTGNLDGNGWVLFIDGRSGGGVANVAEGGFNRFGSMGGERTDDWGTDIDGGDGVSPTPGGGSIVS